MRKWLDRVATTRPGVPRRDELRRSAVSDPVFGCPTALPSVCRMRQLGASLTQAIERLT